MKNTCTGEDFPFSIGISLCMGSVKETSNPSELVLSKCATIETFVQGEEPALVVLPSYGRGGGADFDQFAALAASAGFRVLRPQPRGVGRSAGPMRASLQDMADDIAEVVRQLGHGSATVLGHAFGNGIARLLATGFFAPHHDPRPWLDGWYPATLQMQRHAVHAVEPVLFSKAGTAPILQIIAESDPFSPYETWRALRDQCGDRVTARIVADASHALFPEQTPQVARIVIEWLGDPHRRSAS